jgi:hypothetical protein
MSRKFDDFLRCGGLQRGFLRGVCDNCKNENIVVLYFKRRGLCPCCCSRKIAESAALMRDAALKVTQFVSDC